MGTITYDVAVSIDGFISGQNDDVSQCPMEGDHVDAYLARMLDYDAVVMGRKTYEFGYQHGLEPGQAPYPNMDHFIVSRTLEIPADSAVSVVSDAAPNAVDAISQIIELKARYQSVYLCGGGELAGALLDHDLIDRLCLKIAPVVLGDGVRLFARTQTPTSFACESATRHDSGVTTVQYVRSGR